MPASTTPRQRVSRTTPGPDRLACGRSVDELFDWIDGEVSATQGRALARHVASCEHCGGLTANLRRAIAACQRLGDCRVPREIHRRARARARQLLRGR